MDDGYDDGREEETHRERAGDREHRSDRDTGKKSSDKESKEEATQEIRTLIDNHQVGGIIGKGGSNVKKVRDETGAFVSILKAEFRNVQERIMVLKGTSTQIAKGCRLLADLLMDVAHQKEKKENSDSLSDTIAIRFLVHRSAVGAVIGKAGAVIKETQSDSGARVQVSNEPLPQSTEKTVTITGTPAQIEHAALRILTQLRDNPIRSGTKVFPYVPGQPLYAQPPSYAPPHYGQPVLYPSVSHSAPTYIAPVSSSSQPPSTQKIAIPTVCAGCVIGKGGSVIRDLRAQSGTNISIADPDPNAQTERVVTISGTPQGIQTAVYLIRQLVEQYQPTPSYT